MAPTEGPLKSNAENAHLQTSHPLEVPQIQMLKIIIFKQCTPKNSQTINSNANKNHNKATGCPSLLT